MNLRSTELKAALDAGQQVTILDVRTPAEFGEIHIPGAVLMPLDRLDPTAVKSAAKDAHLCVLVCRSGRRATQAQQTLASSGCPGVRILDGGVDAWAAAGYPVTRGKSAISLERQVRIAAGFLVVTGVVLGTAVHAGFHGLSAFVGAGLMFAGITDWCGMAMVLARMPWNQRSGIPCAGNSCSL